MRGKGRPQSSSSSRNGARSASSIDEDMPVAVIAPKNAQLEKPETNLDEVRARGGGLCVFADDQVPMQESVGVTVIRLPQADDLIDQLMVSTIAMQLLACRVAVLQCTDVVPPRNVPSR